MTLDWTVLAWTVAAALLMWLVQRQLHKHIQGLVLLATGKENLVAIGQFLLFLPGIVLHECSHWLAAKLLGVRVGAMSIGPQRGRGRQVRFGSVQIGRTDAVRESLVGLAPLISGTGLVLLLARWGFGLLPTTEFRPEVWPQQLMACLRAEDAGLWVYLIFAVANAMLPSPSDRRAWRAFGLYLALVAALAFGLMGIPKGNEAWLQWGLHFLSYLAYAFSLTTVVDLAALTLVLALEWLIGLLTGRRIEYLS